MTADFGDAIIVVRDWQYLEYRYVKHPERIYELCLLKDTLSSEPLCLIVLYKEEERIMLSDLVGPVCNFHAAIRFVRSYCREQGFPSLYTWVSEPFAHLLSEDAQQFDPQITIPSNFWSPGPLQSDLADRWWLMIGDTDFL